MLDHSITSTQVDSPPLVPNEQPVDFAHLNRMTLGDQKLEREVLALFDRQAGLLIERMRKAAPAGVAAHAHTLKGSARGIGAFAVARAAEAVERAAIANVDLRAAIDALAATADVTRTAIADLLKAH